MAERRGGMRVPNDRSPVVSGVGKHSRRTDNQPVDVGRLSDAEDLKHGDMERLKAGVRQRPLQRAQSPEVASAVDQALMSPAPNRGGQFPDFLFDMESNRPQEPLTAGMAEGPGPGPDVLAQPPADDRQALLQWLARGGNQDALNNLHGYMDSQRPAETPVQSPLAAVPQEEPDVSLDDGLGDEESEPLIEEPAEEVPEEGVSEEELLL